MIQIAFAVKYRTPVLLQKLELERLALESAGLAIYVYEKEIGRWPHFFCELRGSGPDKHGVISMKKMLARCLSDIVLKEQVAPYIEEVLAQHYYYLPRNERQKILSIARKNYENEQEISSGGRICAEVQKSLHGYLENHIYLNLHGFILFRLQPWLQCLRKNVDKAVDDFLMEKEYQEFIKLLKYFVSLQEPKIRQIHVTLTEGGGFLLLGQQHEVIRPADEGMVWNGEDSVSDEEDRLVSFLVAAAPRNIVLHRQVYTIYPKAADTLKHVFENRVTICKCCKLCCDESKHLNLKGK